MTDTTIDIEATSNTATPLQFMLMHLIITLLAPMFLGVTAGNISHARMAAIETVNAYRARSHADLIAVAQIIAFGLAALGSLSLSFADEIPVSMVLRLRGNANALNRSAEQNRRTLKQNHANDPVPHYAAPAAAPATIVDDGDLDEIEVMLNAEAARTLAAESQERLRDAGRSVDQAPDPEPAELAAPTPAPMTAEERHQAMWAIAMVKEAKELTASIPNLPPAERASASIRAAALNNCASDLLSGVPIPPLEPAPWPGSSDKAPPAENNDP